MKNILLISLISTLSCVPAVRAGSMGGELTNSGFIAIEGGYAVNSIKNFEFDVVGTNNVLTSVKDNQNYAARLAAGMLFMMDEQWGITSELGWGYYGNTKLIPATGLLDIITTKYTISGFDALIGLSYIQPSFTISLKGGALIQNMQKHINAYVNDTFFIGDFFSFDSKSIQTAALPEIKLGAAFNIDNNWSITGSYMFAAGSSPKLGGSFNVNTLNASFFSNTQNSTLNVGLLGIQYTC